MTVEVPPFEILRALAPLHSDFIHRVLHAAAFFPDARPSSWWRATISNADVGGDPFSQHLLGLGLDVEVQDRTKFAQAARRAGLVAVDEGTHVHLQAFQAGVIPRQVFSQFRL